MHQNPDDDFAKQVHGFHSRGYLPHEKRVYARYFVTFRLADSLPVQVLERLQAELDVMTRSMPAGMSDADREMRVKLQRHREIEKLLDHGTGECWLRQPDIAELVARSLTFFHGARYDLRAWVVMPNHVHVLLVPAAGHTLGSIIKSWKQFTSTRARRLLGLPEEGGRFWQPESYDHWIRDADEYERIVSYIHHNPVKARLCAQPWHWLWSSACGKHPHGIL